MKKKYEFTGGIIRNDGITLHRIRRISDDLIGGFIEKEENLSREDACFVYGNSKVWGNARVAGNAEVCGNALVYGNAGVSEDAKVYGNARVSGSALVYGSAEVYDDAEVYDNARVCSNSTVHGSAIINGRIVLRDSVVVSKTPLALNGLDYRVVRTDHHMLIGCFTFPLSKIPKRITEAWLRKKVNNAPHREWYKKHKSAINFLLHYKQK